MLTEEAQQKHLNCDPYWATDLMVALENKRLCLTLEWAIDSMKALVEITTPSYQQKAMDWLVDLVTMHNKSQLTPNLMEKSQQIWHEQRDIIHTAIAHLYAALAYFSEGNISWYRRSLMSSMSVMGDHEYYRQTSLTIPLLIFEKLMTASNIQS